LEVSYGNDMLVLVVASGFLERLLSKPDIELFSQAAILNFLRIFVPSRKPRRLVNPLPA
jgi:hypothetical protein